MTKAVLSLGSNLGDRLVNLQFAVDELAKSGCSIIGLSSVYETDPVGGVEQEPFLNAVAVVETDLEPVELLHLGLQIENLANRVREVHWGPRTLDIDVIDVFNFSSRSKELSVPHPRAHERAFVLVPLFEIEPNWKIGGTQIVSQLLDDVSNQIVLKRSDLFLKRRQS